MTTKIILLITIIAYSIIASQSFMYMLSLKHVQTNLNATQYITVRQLTDSAMQNNFRYVIYAALLANILLVVANIKNPGSIIFITSCIAFVALLADTLLTLKGSMPVNSFINTWSVSSYPSNWTEYRDQWFSIFHCRQIINLTGFAALLTGAVFGLK